MCDAAVLAAVRGDLSNCKADFGTVGHDIFAKMFERPGVQDQFPKYKGKGVGEVKDAITAHGKKVVEQLVQFVKEADNKSVLDGMVADFIALHKKNNIPHSSLAGSKGDIVAVLAKHGCANGSWGAFMDFFFAAVKF